MQAINIESSQLHGALRWIHAILICFILTIAILVSYIGALIVLKTEELTAIYNSFMHKISSKIPALASFGFVKKSIERNENFNTNKDVETKDNSDTPRKPRIIRSHSSK